VRLQGREHVVGKSPDLLHEHLVRQYYAIETDLHVIGAGRVGRLDDPLGDLGRGAPRHLLGLPLDIGHRQAAKILAGELRGAAVFRAHVIGRGGARIARLTLQFGLGKVAVAEQGLIEIEVVGPHLAHRLGLAVRDIGADAERKVVGGDPVARSREAPGVIADNVVAQSARAAEPGVIGRLCLAANSIARQRD
jgi:hypothetical protein